MDLMGRFAAGKNMERREKEQREDREGWGGLTPRGKMKNRHTRRYVKSIFTPVFAITFRTYTQLYSSQSSKQTMYDKIDTSNVQQH